MSLIKKLAGETAIYGLSSIVGRLINFFLTPFYVRVFTEGDNGVIYDFYTLSAFIIVIFSYRLETAFFRYGSDPAEKEKAFSTALTAILFSSCVFVLILLSLSHPIASIMKYPDHPEYVQFFAGILFLDALAEVPFARLRLDRRPIRFAIIRLTWVLMNVFFNLLFLFVLPGVMKGNFFSFLLPVANLFYDPSIGVGYVFISNLLASLITLLLLIPYYTRTKLLFDKAQFAKMFKFSWPLIIVSFAGTINEMLDRQLLKYLLPYSIEKNKAQLGIYGANYKLAMLITLFGQAFRYAAEPFFFLNAKNKDSPKLYARITKYFTLVTIAGFLVITLFLHIFKYYVGDDGSGFHEGLKVVPILIWANIFLALYYNISTWYKLSDMTVYGIFISLFGAAITIGLNVWWIPIYGYVGSAWATLICYSTMAFVSYHLGRKHYELAYNWISMFGYMFFALGIYAAHSFLVDYLKSGFILTSILSTAGLLLFIGTVYFIERDTIIKQVEAPVE